MLSSPPSLFPSYSLLGPEQGVFLPSSIQAPAWGLGWEGRLTGGPCRAGLGCGGKEVGGGKTGSGKICPRDHGPAHTLASCCVILVAMLEAEEYLFLVWAPSEAIPNLLPKDGGFQPAGPEVRASEREQKLTNNL